ncbi:MAG: hypothetical protein ACXVBE_11470 [Bdellovibrionota bacterium]
MKTLFLIFTLSLSACANNPAKKCLGQACNSQPATAKVMPSVQAEEDLKKAVMPAKQPFTYSSEKAEALLTGLKAIGVKPVKDGNFTVYSAYDLSCSLDMGASIGPSTHCEFWDAPIGSKNRRKHEVKGQESYEDLRSLLFQYPVDQGDPGAMTHFAQCRILDKTPDCSIAIQVNYEGP